MTQLSATNGSPRRQSGKRMSLANVQTTVRRSPMRIVIWGTPGVGKTTMAAQAPNPIFVCAEQGAEQIGAHRFEPLESFADYTDAIGELLTQPHQYKTLVIDSLAPLEALLHKHICTLKRWSSIDDPAYGRGFSEALDWWRGILDSLDRLRKERGMHIVMIGHSTTKSWKNPEGDDFDRYECKVHTRAWELIKAWADAVLFARHEVLASTKDKRTRGVSNGARVLCTQWRASYDAKVRWVMPETIPLSWDDFIEYVEQGYSSAAIDRMRQALKELGDLLKDTEHADKVSKALEWAGSDPVRLSQSLERLRALAGLAGVSPPSATEAQDPEPGSFGLCLRSCRSMRSIGTSSAYAQDLTGPVLATSSRPSRHAPSSRASPGMGRPSGRTSSRVSSLSRPSTRTWRLS